MIRIDRLFKEVDVLSGSIVKNVFKLAAPLFLVSVFYFILWSLNIYWVSRLGPEAIAAVTIGGAGLMLMLAPIQGLITAAYGLLGEFAGSRDSDSLPAAGRQALAKLAKEMLVITWFASLAIALIGCFLAPWFLTILCGDSAVVSSAVLYLRIQLIGGIITFSLWMANGMLKSIGNMAFPFIVACLVVGLNAVFDPLFIFGFGPIPGLGVAGAALASVLSAGIGSLFVFQILASGKSAIKIDFKGWKLSDFRVSSKTLKEVARISVPDMFEGILRSATALVIMGIVALYGVAALAAYGIGMRLLSISSLFGFDLAAGSAIILANNLGAGNVKRAIRSVWLSCAVSILFMGAIGALAFVFAENIIGIFSQDPDVLRLGVSYIRIITPSYFFLAVGIVLRRAFAGAKDSLTPMLVNCFVFVLFQIPLALILSGWFGIGIEGVWLAILTANVCYGLILAALFKIGYWKKKSSADKFSRNFHLGEILLYETLTRVFAFANMKIVSVSSPANFALIKDSLVSEQS